MDKKQTKKILSNYRKLMAEAGQLEVALNIYEGCREELTAQLSECLALAKQIEKAIRRQKDLRKREILIRKYIYGDTLTEIADKLCFSSRHIQRLLDSAVNDISL